MNSKVHQDLSDNRYRGNMLERLIHEVSLHAPAVPFQSWTSEMSPQSLPMDFTTVADAWKLHNDSRVMSQYCRVLRDACKQNYFLTGAQSTCVEGLEWFHCFSQPVLPLSGLALEHMRDFLEACMLHKGTLTAGQAAFDAHQAIVKPDRHLTQFLIEHHFPGPHKHYELDVCAYMVAMPDMTYNRWQATFPTWRRLGLFFPMALASLFMPTLDCWLPLEAHETPVAISLSACLCALRNPLINHQEHLDLLAQDWARDTTGASDIISGKLDRLAILMGVKSNGNPFELGWALNKFAETFPICEHESPSAEIHSQNYLAWHALKASVEKTFPPSLLAAPLVRPKRDTWGYQKLTLSVSPSEDAVGHVVTFAEHTLEHVKASKTCSNLAYTYHPPFIKECSMNQTSQRIQDVLWRLGEIATSPEMSLCMLRPDMALAILDLSKKNETENQILAQLDISTVLKNMSERDKQKINSLKECYLFYTNMVESIIPQPVSLQLPLKQAALFWRLDTPSRAILYTGSEMEVDPHLQSTHHLPKVMINAKFCHRPIGGIIKVQCDSQVDTLRKAICSFGKDGLAVHPANTVLITKNEFCFGNVTKLKSVAPATCTTLAETIACFGLTNPNIISQCNLGLSNSWKEDGIDPRYAEKQLAENGFRFRDWTALHVNQSGTQQSRLACHVAEYDCLHTIAIPWYADNDHVRWVHVSATLPPKPRTLQGKTLRQAVDCRYMHDLRMLPTENNTNISKPNAEIYTDPQGCVGIAYCLDDSPKIHFICFECIENY